LKLRVAESGLYFPKLLKKKILFQPPKYVFLFIFIGVVLKCNCLIGTIISEHMGNL